MMATCDRRTFTGDRDRALLLALLDTGCRASESVALDVQDVNMTTGAVIIRSGKGGKFRTAFMGASTRREVLRYLRHGTENAGPLWVTPEGGRLTYAGLRSIVRRRARAAGLSVPSLHSFRRAFALGMLKGGADILSISRLLGHADLSLLQRYIRQMVDDLAAVHRRAGPVDKLLAFMLCLLTALWMKP
jgi:site-specific recombinase XerD